MQIVARILQRYQTARVEIRTVQCEVNPTQSKSDTQHVFLIHLCIKPDCLTNIGDESAAAFVVTLNTLASYQKRQKLVKHPAQLNSRLPVSKHCRPKLEAALSLLSAHRSKRKSRTTSSTPFLLRCRRHGICRGETQQKNSNPTHTFKESTRRSFSCERTTIKRHNNAKILSPFCIP
jgi:hypothetical protein